MDKQGQNDRNPLYRTIHLDIRLSKIAINIKLKEVFTKSVLKLAPSKINNSIFQYINVRTIIDPAPLLISMRAVRRILAPKLFIVLKDFTRLKAKEE